VANSSRYAAGINDHKLISGSCTNKKGDYFGFKATY